MDAVIQILVNRFKSRNQVNVPTHMENHFISVCLGIGVSPKQGKSITNQHGNVIGREYTL